jgi:hypothetical protein
MPRHFNNWIKTYVQHTSSSEAPDVFHFWTGVVTVGGALRRRVWIEQNLFQWVPNFYVILVSPPGVVTKSTSISLGMRLLRQVDGIHFGPESMTWQALADDLEKAMEYVDVPDPVTGKPVSTPMSCLTIEVSELGTFLRTDDSQLVSFLTRMWDGQRIPFKHRTKNSGNIDVENPWLNIISATTPGWMRDHFSISLVEQGLTSRIVFVYGDTKRHFVAYPSKLTKGTNYHDEEKKLIEDLKQIALLSGEYKLTPEAEHWGEAWYHTHYTKLPTHLASDRFGGYVARKQTHLHKLAMVLAASKRENLIIEKEDLEEADVILTSSEQSMIKVFENVGLVDEARHVKEIVALVKGYHFIEAAELRNLTANTISDKDFKLAVRVAVEQKILAFVKNDQGKHGFVLTKRTIN